MVAAVRAALAGPRASVPVTRVDGRVRFLRGERIRGRRRGIGRSRVRVRTVRLPLSIRGVFAGRRGERDVYEPTAHPLGATGAWRHHRVFDRAQEKLT